VILRGREHHHLGAVDVVSEGPAAVAISIGGARKAYAHTDPNEDAAAFALGEAGRLVAVADGHRGFEAAEVLLEHLLEHPAPHWTAPGGVTAQAWSRHALAALADANAAIRGEAPPDAGRPRTTLTLAVARPEEDALLFACVGDSLLFRAGAEGVEELAPPAEAEGFFLGHGPESADSLEKKVRLGCVPLAGTRALVAVTDGLSERHVGVDDPPAAVADALAVAAGARAALRPATLARDLCERALTAHRRNPSGDNVAAAVLWLAS
jgi:hypothetical protein